MSSVQAYSAYNSINKLNDKLTRHSKKDSIQQSSSLSKSNNSQVPLNTFKAYHFNNKAISFGTLRYNAGKPIDTEFCRGLSTINAATDEVSSTFPKGTTVLSCAGSNGEEAYSLAMKLGEEYKIIGLDVDSEAIKLAKNGIHSVFSGASDSFLIEDEEKLTDEQKYLKMQFNKFFSETEAPKEGNFNNSIEYIVNYASAPDFKIKYFKVNDVAKDAVEFREPVEGDILNIDNFEPDKKVGAIFFRNSFYHLTSNNIDKVLCGLSSDDVDTAVIDEIVDKVHSRLEKGGVFVVGNNIKEHMFLAPENAPDDEVIKYSDTSMFKKVESNLECLKGSTYYEPAMERLDEARNVKFMKKLPLEQALEKDGRFKPIHWESVDVMPEIRVPTVWKKVD